MAEDREPFCGQTPHEFPVWAVVHLVSAYIFLKHVYECHGKADRPIYASKNIDKFKEYKSGDYIGRSC
jgi:hypothetical protein